MKKEGNLFSLKIFLLIFIGVLLSVNLAYSAVSSLSSLNQTALENEAALCLNESSDILVLMQLDKFNVVRMNDSFKDAKNLYDSQVILKGKNKPYDFSAVVKYCTDIKTMRENAVNSAYELDALL